MRENYPESHGHTKAIFRKCVVLGTSLPVGYLPAVVWSLPHNVKSVECGEKSKWQVSLLLA